MRLRTLLLPVIALALASSSCAKDLKTHDDAGTMPDGSPPPPDGGIPAVSGAFTHSVDADGIVTTVVNATDTTAWRSLDLDTGFSVEPTAGWDLGFLRFRVRTNGGVSGAGGVQVAALPAQTFEALERAPEAGWTSDRPDGTADDDTEPDNVFNNGTDDWYSYDPTTHMLTPKDVTYVVASTEGRFYKLRIDSYYDGAGSPAMVRFRWAEIAPPTTALPDGGMPGDGGVLDGDVGAGDGGTEPIPADAVVVDASSASSWVYVSVENGVVAPASPETSLDWDVAFRRTEIRTSSGTSGAGLGGARLDGTGAAFEAITEATTLGYDVDEVQTSGAPGAVPTSVSPVLAGWYDYDVATHTVSPGDRIYLVRTASGDYAKLRIWRWTNGEYTLSLVPVARRVDVVELEVDASATDVWTYVSLRDGSVVAVTDPATEGGWDLGISRTRMRTNGGTSGAGAGAAVETTATEIADLTAAPADGWTIDALIADGPPGSPEFSGNPVLAGWYAYDPVTHVVSPRVVVFALRTADGHSAALQVRSYAAGIYRIAIEFAGPGHTDF